jgi:divalent metal cation (Fe/Co/Zn/Cd) transporter
MIGTVLINLAVIRYETREADRLASEVLLADALQTRGDVWTSATVLVALAGARWDCRSSTRSRRLSSNRVHRPRPASDRGRRRESSATDRDFSRGPRANGDERAGVVGCHHIRTRRLGGSRVSRYARVDARRVAADRRARLVARGQGHVDVALPQIVDAVIHLEPPPVR